MIRPEPADGMPQDPSQPPQTLEQWWDEDAARLDDFGRGFRKNFRALYGDSVDADGNLVAQSSSADN